MRGRKSPFGVVDSLDDGRSAPTGPEFINQFPYKSCQRSKSARKVTGHKWPHDKPPTHAPQRKVSIKRKKYAGKLQDASFDHIPSASRPVSPDTQLERMVTQDQETLSEEEVQVYTRYIEQELQEENIEVMSKELLDKIK